MSREHAVQNQIIRAFGTRSDMRLWRANVLAAQMGKHYVRAGVPGQADLTGLLRDGRRLEIEVKSAAGDQSPEQRAFQRMIERFNGLYVLARSVDDVWAALKAAGYERPVTKGQISCPVNT